LNISRGFIEEKVDDKKSNNEFQEIVFKKISFKCNKNINDNISNIQQNKYKQDVNDLMDSFFEQFYEQKYVDASSHNEKI